MKKFIKQVNKSVQSGAETLINAADMLVLDTIVTQILKNVKQKILSYDYSLISSRNEIPSLAEVWFQEGYQEFDKRAGTTTDEDSNIAVRRRNLRRGYKTKLELFYQTYDEYQTNSQEKLLELQSFDILMKHSREEMTRYESDVVTKNGGETPDILERNYNDFKINHLEGLKLKIVESKFIYLGQEFIENKVTAFEESLDQMKIEFIEKRVQV
jgi:hypothetical protein